MPDHGTILVVDDSPPSREFLTEVLTAAGYHVHQEDSGARALASVADRPPELILLDLRMPDMDGFEVLRRLKTRQDSRSIPVLFISAVTQAKERVEGLRLGAVDFVSKPFHQEELLARVRTHLEMSRLRARLEQQAASLQSAYDRLESEMAQRQRAQETLAASERKFQATLYSIGDAVITTDTGGRVQEMNRVAEALTGWTEADARDKPLGRVFRVVDGSTRAEMESPAEAALRGGKPVGLSSDAVLIARDGTERSIADSTAPIRDGNGAVSGVVLVFSDQTVQRASQQALAESEERLRLALAAADQGLFDLDVQTGESIVSPAYARMLGYEPAEFHETHAAWTERLHPDDRERVEGVYCDYVAGRREEYRVEFRHRAKDGHWKWILALGRLVSRSSDGRPLRMLGTHTDVTERKQAEDQLRLSQSTYEGIINSITEALYIQDQSGVFLAVNAAAERMYGYPREYFRGRTPEFISAPGKNDLAQIAGYVSQAFHGQSREFEFWGLKKDGTVFPKDVRVSPGTWFGQNVVVAVARDITERKQAERALRESEEIFDQFMQHSPIYVFFKDDAIRAVRLSANYATMLGRPISELLGKSMDDLFPSDLARSMVADDQRILREGQQVDVEEELNGRTYATTKFPIYHEGKARYLAGYTIDISERRRAEAELRLQSAALVAAANAMVITDREGTIAWVNPAFTSLTGYSAEEAIGKNPRDLVKSGLHDDALYKDLWQSLLAGRVWHGEMTNRRKDGSLYPEEQTITPVRDVRGEIAHFIAIKRDLTKEKHLQAQLLQSQKMEGVGQLAGGIAHDFNNLLTVINGTADLASRKLRAADPLRGDLLQIQRAGERAASLTRQLLAFSRKQMMTPRVLNLNTLAADLSGMLQRLIGEDIDLVVVPARDVGSVKADPGQIEQVILNLALNARDAMPGGGRLTIETRDVELDAAHAAGHPSVEPGPHVMLAVSDTGIGMDEATRLRIFEPFFTTKEPGKGTGLGLSTVYGIVKQSGGSIWVYSEPGTGTTFKVYLPRVEEVAQQGQPARPVVAVAGTETVLVVEDEDTLRELVKEILQSVGYTVLKARNGEDALLLLERHQGPVHLLLTDVVMPGISGRDLASRVVETRPEIKVLYTSGYTDDAILRHGVLDDTTNFLPKPFAIEELTRKVREALDSPNGLQDDRTTANRP